MLVSRRDVSVSFLSLFLKLVVIKLDWLSSLVIMFQCFSSRLKCWQLFPACLEVATSADPMTFTFSFELCLNSLKINKNSKNAKECCCWASLSNQLFSLWKPFNPLTAELSLRALIDFTLSNARRFYSSIGNPLAGKGLMPATRLSESVHL